MAAVHDLPNCYSLVGQSRNIVGLVQADIIHVHVSPESSQEHLADKTDQPGDVASTHNANVEQQIVEPVLPWKVSEDELRSDLADYGSYHVLHLTGTGLIVMNNQRKWERRMSHAMHDRWRFILF